MVIVLLLSILIIWYIIKTYNIVKPLEILIKEADSNIGILMSKRDFVLKRMDEIVKTYSTYEKSIIERLSNDMKPKSSVFMNINRLYDAYPELKLNDAFTSLANKLFSIENERQNVAEYYNVKVKNYNEFVTSFPAIVPCKLMSFSEKKFFNK